jgi:hypothetical protein
LPERLCELDAAIGRVHARDRIGCDVYLPVVTGREQRYRYGDEGQHHEHCTDEDPRPRSHRLRRWRRRVRPEAFDRVNPFRNDADDHDRVRDALERQRPAILVPRALDPPREVSHLAGGEDLAGASLAAEPGRQVQRRAPKATLDRNGFASIQPNANRQWQLWMLERLLDEALLEVEGGTDRVARRGKDTERLVPSELEERSTARLHDLSRDVRELRRELGGRFVASLLREQGVPADVCDEERPDVDFLGTLGSA